LVAQIFVHGDSLCSCLVAVVVPEFADVQKLFGGTEETIVRSADVRKAILDDLKKLGTASGLKGFELVRQIHLCAAPFAVDNELLTPTFKNKRPALRKHFAKEIEAMYRELGEISSA
jgi:long-chain acyl-CoA synthetase